MTRDIVGSKTSDPNGVISFGFPPQSKQKHIHLQETDYATNFAADGNGPWKDSGLGQAFRGALERPVTRQEKRRSDGREQKLAEVGREGFERVA